MIPYPDINPIAFTLGPLAVRWYGLMYLLGFLVAWWLGHQRAKQPHNAWTSTQVSDLIYYSAIGVILGGRLGYMLFYDLSGWLADPLKVFYIRQGGMSFHGGLLGVTASLAYLARKYRQSFWQVTDFAAPLVPIGLGCGRLGNFINGELWGRITPVPWAMVFPRAGPIARHPSQLYELVLEGLLLFALLWWFSRVKRPLGAVTGLFLMAYAIFRMIAEFFRVPDPQIGYLGLGWLTMGQLLSIPMLLLGGWLLVRRQRGL